MRRSELYSSVRSLLAPGTRWPTPHGDFQDQDGKAVLMLVCRIADVRLAIKLIDFVYPLTASFWAVDTRRHHVIMDACDYGVHPSVLLRLMKCARKCTLNMVAPMSMLDIDGLDALEVAIKQGHGELASCLLGEREPASYYDSFCNHYPLEVLELAIDSINESCVGTILTNKRVRRALQPGATEKINASMRSMQRQKSRKRLFNLFTCVGAAVRCNMQQTIQTLLQINPKETRQAVWYAVCTLKLEAPELGAQLSTELKRMANIYFLDKVWPQVGVFILHRNRNLVASARTERSLWQRTRQLWQRSRRDLKAPASLHPLVAIPHELFFRILIFLLPSETAKIKKSAFLVAF